MLTGTYSPDDNKLRLYASERLGDELYKRVRSHGFIWAPKQDLFVAPAWTPERADFLIELCGEIGDEDTSLAERADERAVRFDGYRERRADDADRAHAAVSELAGNIPLGQPILVGHHSEKHARRDAERIERGMRKAIDMWRTSEYWQRRASGAIRHAKYKERPDVRARRIKGLEAERRKMAKEHTAAQGRIKLWAQINNPHRDGRPCDDQLRRDRALAIANRYSVNYGTWSELDENKITPRDAQIRSLKANAHIFARAGRWIEHLDHRLAYERAMLADAGGTVADRVAPEAGGACRCWVRKGWIEIQKVNRVSVTVLDNWGNGGADFTRTVSFDKLAGILSRADWEACGKAPYWTPDAAPTPAAEPAEPAAPSAADRQVERSSALFDAMRESLKAGVQVVAAPQLFPTPADVARQVIERAQIDPGMDVLEPSAGTGALLDALFNDEGTAWLGAPGRLVAVEVNQSLAKHLERVYAVADVRCADFLGCNGDLGLFDRIIMNPPFGQAADIKHIMHARKFLKPGGRIVAICANGPRQRDALEGIAGGRIELPAGAFAESGTNVNAVIVVIYG